MVTTQNSSNVEDSVVNMPWQQNIAAKTLSSVKYIHHLKPCYCQLLPDVCSTFSQTFLAIEKSALAKCLCPAVNTVCNPPSGPRRTLILE